ncbi:hypothetical protein MNBD_GAMMA22-1754 [hydrothermal vent metagenome]|uniref:Thioredoxin domain-containing protein n=1 Tax=hydrothermal vent metagenome TaxID=652676 RepID=A0A3B0ZSU3_9ZZZZ
MIETIESELIHDANEKNFSELVIGNSNLGPVLANFWSRTAGPCLRQYPVLDKLVHNYQGRLLLVNIDTEKELVISKKFSVVSVPTLKLFRFGEVVNTFHGYQIESELKKIIDKLVVRNSDSKIERAMHEYTAGNLDKAYQILSDAIIEDQINPRLPLTVCKLLKHQKRDIEAFNLLESLPTELKNDAEIQQLHIQLFFSSILASVDDIKVFHDEFKNNKDNLLMIKQMVAYFVVDKKYEQALLLIEKIIKLEFNYDNNFARSAMLHIFTLLGEDHNVIKKFRPLLLKYTH